MTITNIQITINHQGLILFRRKGRAGGGVPGKPSDGWNGKGGMSENAGGGGGEGVARTIGGIIEDGGEGMIVGGGWKGLKIIGGWKGFGGSVNVFWFDKLSSEPSKESLGAGFIGGRNGRPGRLGRGGSCGSWGRLGSFGIGANWPISSTWGNSGVCGFRNDIGNAGSWSILEDSTALRLLEIWPFDSCLHSLGWVRGLNVKAPAEKMWLLELLDLRWNEDEAVVAATAQ